MASNDQELKAQAEIRNNQRKIQLENEQREKKEAEDKQWQYLCRELFQLVESKEDRKAREEDDDETTIDYLDTAMAKMHSSKGTAAERTDLVTKFQEAALRSTKYRLLHTDLEAIVSIIQRYRYVSSPSVSQEIHESKALDKTVKESIAAVRAARKRDHASLRPQLEQLFHHRCMQRLPPRLLSDLEDAYESTSQQRVIASGSASGSIFLQTFPYIANQKLALEKLDADGPGDYSTTESTASARIVHIIQNPSSCFEASVSATPSAKYSVLQVISVAQTIVSGVAEFPRNSDKMTALLQTMQQKILEKVQHDNKVNSVDSSGFYATLICAIYRALPGGVREVWSKVLQTTFHAVPILIPDLSDYQTNSVDDDIATMRLYASVLAYQIPTGVDKTTGAIALGKSSVTPMTISFAWRWLLRLTEQLYVLISHRRNNASDAGVAFSLDLMPSANIAHVLNAFLLRTAHSLSIYYQGEFTQFLGHFQKEFLASSGPHGMLKGFDDVKTRVSSILSKNGACPPLYYLQQDPFVLEAVFHQQQYLVTLEGEVTEWERDRTGPFMKRVKALEIDRLRAVFNRMGATEESRTASIKQLLEKIVLASKDSPEMLRYTLFKVVQHVSTDCQDDNFNEMEESHPLKLARVVCSIGRDIPQLTDIFRANFTRQCPLLIPRLLAEGIDEALGLQALGFNFNRGSSTLESKESWLKRMGKMLTTAVVIAIQPEQIVFSHETLWTILARLTNTSLRTPTPPFFVPTIYEIVLRVAGQILHRHYGQAFMQLMKIVQTQVMPKFGDNATIPKRVNVQKFLDRFISSNGSEFLGFFNQRNDLIHGGDGVDPDDYAS